MGVRVFHDYLQEVCEPIEVQIGVPLTPGAYQRGDAVNFAIFSRHATCVWLELFDGPEDKTRIRVIVLDSIHHRTGDAWHAWVTGLVGPILRNITPVHEYKPKPWRQPEADRIDRIIEGDGGWRNPKPEEAIR